MKEIVGVVVACALLIGMSALAIESGDRETFVAPPGAVAEGFVREVLAKRWDRARAYLVEPESVSDAEIAALEEAWSARVGEASRIEAETIWRDAMEGRVVVRLESEEGSERVEVGVVFVKEWKVDLCQSRAGLRGSPYTTVRNPIH